MGVFSKTVAGAGLSMMLGIGAFAFGSEDDDNQIYNLQATKSKEVLTQVSESTDIEKFNSNTMVEETILSFLPEFEGFGVEFIQPTPTPATNGSGLNLLLIQQMAEGYCKDYLSIAEESENGTLCETPTMFNTTVQTVIGINITESSTYKCGYIPWGEIPDKSGGVPMYYTTGDGSQYNLYTYHQNNKVGGAFQYTQNNSADDTFVGASIYHDKNNIPAGAVSKGNCHYFPDAVAGLSTRFDNVIKTLNIDATTLTDEQKQLIAKAGNYIVGAGHNLGEEGCAYSLYGVDYIHIGGKNGNNAIGPSRYSYVDMKADDTDTKLAILEALTSHLTVDLKTNDVEMDELLELTGDKYGNVVIMCAMGWNCTENAVHYWYNKESRRQIGLKVWNALKPEESQNSPEELRNHLLKSYAIPLATKLGVSESTVQSVYGVAGGDTYYSGDDSPSHLRGQYYLVTDIQSNAYKNAGGPTRVVISIENNAGEKLVRCSLAPIVYAMMLCMGGNVSSVDPTNPDTYMITMELGDTAGATAGQLINGGLDSGLAAFMVEKGITAVGLNETRTKALNLAWDRWVDIACAYSQGGDPKYKDYLGHESIPRLMYTADLKNTPPPKGLDCSGLIFWIYQTNLGYKNIPENTRQYGKSSVKKIPLSNIKSGDIFRRAGHVALFFGKANINGKEYYVTLEYSTEDTFDVISPRVRKDGLTLEYHGMKLGYYTQKGDSVVSFTENYTVNGVN